MDEQFEFLKLIVGRLETARIPYMVSGSTALNVYAQPRMTRDIDFIIDPRLEEADLFTDLFKADCYIDSETVRQAIHKRDFFNVIHNEWVLKADFVVRKAEPFRIEEFRRRRKIEVGDLAFYVVTPEDLLLSKLVWARDGGSDLQLRDVRNLLTTGSELDGSYIEHWADILQVRDTLAKAKAP